jgi:NitT/TauT family transport system substrate-binding protein
MRRGCRRRYASSALILLLLAAAPAIGADRARIGYTSPTPNHGILWVAESSGLLKKNNIDLEIIYMPGNISLPSLLAGEIQFAQMTGALMTPGRLQGSDPVMLASVQDFLDDRLVARPEFSSVEQLKGKKIGISRFGAASHMRVLNLLPRFGLRDKDVTFLQIGDTPARIIALVGGAIDASSFSPPDHLAATRAGMKLLYNMRDLNIQYQGTGLVTTQKTVARSRDLVRRMVKAFVEAIHVVRTNSQETKRALAKYRKTNDESQLEEAYQTLKEMARPKPYPSSEGFKTILKDLSDRLPAANTANPNDFIDASFLDELDRKGVIDALYRAG